MALRPYRLAAVTSHPVQYQAPLFRQVVAIDDMGRRPTFSVDRKPRSFDG